MKISNLLLVFFLIAIPLTIFAQTPIGGSVFDITKKAQKEDKEMKDFGEGLESFTKNLGIFRTESMVGKCLSIMSEHASSLAELQNQFEETDNCKKKKEYIEAQSLFLLSGGIIIYCPDELNSDKIRYGREMYEFLEPYFFHIDENKIKADEIREKLKKLMDKEQKLKKELAEMGLLGVWFDPDDPKPEIVIEYESIGFDIGITILELLAILPPADDKDSEETSLINEILSKFLYAQRKFGNKYSIAQIFTKNTNNFKDIEERDKFYSKIVDYFTYYLSPKEFMSKRAQEIAIISSNLPCD